MSDYKITSDVTPAEALGKQGAAIALPQGCSITGFIEEVDRLSHLFGEEKEILARLDRIASSLESMPKPKTEREEYKTLERPYLGVARKDLPSSAIREALATPSIEGVAMERVPRAGKALPEVLLPDRILLPEELVVYPNAGEVAAPYTDRQHDPGNVLGEYTPVVSRGSEPADAAVTSLDAEPKRQDQRGEAWQKDYTIKLIPFEAGSITWRKFLKRTVPYIAAFAAGALTYAFLSDDDESITISSPEEAVMHYNRVVEAAGGQLIVPMPPAANTPEEVCWAAFGRLYYVVDNSPTTEDAEMFTRSLIDAGLCTDVHTEHDYYGFIPHPEISQPTER